MEKVVKATGICCLIVCGFCILTILSIRLFSPEADNVNYHHFYVTIQEGTTLTVANGKLTQTGNGAGFYSVDKPFKRYLKNSCWGLCFLASLIAGMVLLQAAKELNLPSEEQSEAETPEAEGSE